MYKKLFWFLVDSRSLASALLGGDSFPFPLDTQAIPQFCFDFNYSFSSVQCGRAARIGCQHNFFLSIWLFSMSRVHFHRFNHSG
ncbi:hypothetical protein BC567DRAFT_3965 [Phyllosticta citribraziliensis]